MVWQKIITTKLVPSLWEDWSVSTVDSHTYKLRKDAQWFTWRWGTPSVKAQDFVTGIKYAVDNKSLAVDFDSKLDQRQMNYITGQILTFLRLGRGHRRPDCWYALHSRTLQNSKNNQYAFSQWKFLNSKGRFWNPISDSILYGTLFKDFTSNHLSSMKNPHYYDHDKVSIEPWN